MCIFITLVAATDDVDRLNTGLAAWNRRGYARRAERVDTPALRPVLAAEEREYWLVRPPCDCGTFLGHALRQGADTDASRDGDAARFRRKGWSEARIARPLADKLRADARPARREPNEDAAYWIGLLEALAGSQGLTKLGLMYHDYKTSPGTELDTATRCEAGPLDAATEVLASMTAGVIHDFDARARKR